MIKPKNKFLSLSKKTKLKTTIKSSLKSPEVLDIIPALDEHQEEIQKLLGSPPTEDSTGWVATVGKKVVGYIGLRQFFGVDDVGLLAGTVKVGIVCDFEFRGLPIKDEVIDKLMKRVISEAVQSGDTIMSLIEKSKLKMKIYQRYGFRTQARNRLPKYLINYPEFANDTLKKAGIMINDFKPHEKEVKVKKEKQEVKVDPNRPKFLVFPFEQVHAEALANYRRIGFPYPKVPLHVGYQEINRLAQTPEATLMTTDTGYQLADSYHHHRYEAAAIDSRSPMEIFMSDKFFGKALQISLQRGETVSQNYMSTLNVGSSAQPCYNFRPGIALRYYREFCNEDSVVLDTSTGYGGRLVAWMASRCAKYIGIDPHSRVHNANTKMALDYGFADRVQLINLPAEDVDPETLRGQCDFMLTSPPYFNKEHYVDEPTQSDVRYKSPDGWREGFLRKMLDLTWIALKPGSFCVISIGDITVRQKKFELSQWTKIEADRLGFELIRQDALKTMRNNYGEDKEQNINAPLLVFRRP